MGGLCSMHWSDGKRRQNFDRKPKVNRLLGRPRCRWEYNIKMDFNEVYIAV